MEGQVFFLHILQFLTNFHKFVWLYMYMYLKFINMGHKNQLKKQWKRIYEKKGRDQSSHLQFVPEQRFHHGIVHSFRFKALFFNQNVFTFFLFLYESICCGIH